MSTRPDGMPQGHPETQPVVLATLTLQASGDPTKGDLQVSGDLRINGALAKGDPEEVTPPPGVDPTTGEVKDGTDG